MYAMRGMQDADDLVRRIYQAIDRRQPVTLTYVKEEGEIVVRTVEPWKIELSMDRNVFMRTYDRGNGEVRSYRLDRILFYTVHRSRRLVPNEYEEMSKA